MAFHVLVATYKENSGCQAVCGGSQGLITTQSSDPAETDILRPFTVEETTCQMGHVDGQLREENNHLHGGGWQDPICSLFRSENEWQDPICALFQTKTLTTCQADDYDQAGGSAYSLPIQPETPSKLGSGALSMRIDNLSKGSASEKSKIREAPKPAASQDQHQRQENLFRDMGFPLSQIHRALQIHGAQADDSTILQYLLDNDNVRGASCTRQVEHSELELPRKETNANNENISGSVTVLHQQIANSVKKSGAWQFWDNANSDYSDSTDFEKDDEEAPIPPTSRSSIDRTKARGCDYPVTLCKRELDPEGDGHRLLMSNHGFAVELVERAIQELGEGVENDMLLEYLLYLTAQQDPKASTSASCEKQVNTVEKLVAECGYPAKAVERAVSLCETPLWNAEQDQIADLVDFLTAHGGELNKSENEENEVTDGSWLRRQHIEDQAAYESGKGKRKFGYGGIVRKKTVNRHSPRVKLVSPQRRIGRSPQIVNEEVVKAVVDRHHGSVGFGLPGCPVQPRYLDENVKGAPFFYFENMASMANDEWDKIRRHLFDIEPEFVDSLHFSACRRPRGYIHNLPIEGRRKILDDPPMTIHELLPNTKHFWPTWDDRTKLNCITTRMGSEFLIKKLEIGDHGSTSEPNPDQKREILQLCRHWNLVWTAPNIPTPIDEVEIEAMLGFDPGHSSKILSTSMRYKVLGNSFSVYTVAFHFSVLKPLYPRGIKVLSLFSGLGGAEVALHKMGIKLLVVVSLEIDDGTRRCLEAWWAASKQTGVLNQKYHNVKDLGRAQISELVDEYRGFDLVVGGTPSYSLAMSTHVNTQSTIFFEFSRVVAAVRELTMRLQQKQTS